MALDVDNPSEFPEGDDALNRICIAHHERIEKEMDKIRLALVALGVDAGIVAITYDGEDGISRAVVRGFGNYYTQSGLLNHIRNKRSASALTEQMVQDQVFPKPQE